MLNGNTNNNILELNMGPKEFKLWASLLTIFMAGGLITILYSIMIILNRSWKPEGNYDLPLFAFVLVLSSTALIYYSRAIYDSIKKDKKYLK